MGNIVTYELICGANETVLQFTSGNESLIVINLSVFFFNIFYIFQPTANVSK